MQHFRTWLAAIGESPAIEFPIRWLPGSAIAADHPLVTTLAACGNMELGTAPPIQGIEAPCDMYVFHEFGVPAVLWGAIGANLHAPDEYVDLVSLDAAAAVLERFVKEWCGTDTGPQSS